jgi:hypothetical protein
MNTHKHFLREMSKFAAGLVAADFLTGLWFLISGTLPIILFGATWTAFDILLLLVLIHYGWYADVHSPSIKQKNLFRTVGIIIGIVALMHFLRLAFAVSVNIGGWEAPYWMSWVSTIVGACISYASFRFASK